MPVTGGKGLFGWPGYACRKDDENTGLEPLLHPAIHQSSVDEQDNAQGHGMQVHTPHRPQAMAPALDYSNLLVALGRFRYRLPPRLWRWRPFAIHICRDDAFTILESIQAQNVGAVSTSCESQYSSA